MIHLVLGGARSGKSTFAEQLAADSGKAVRYVATATGDDTEMQDRIARHQAQRPSHWALSEEPMALAQLIAEQQNTNLAVVAPGIAEALLATGLGLLAAIPAVVFYNKLSSDSDCILGGYEAFADEFGTILSRQLDA